jgi:4-hydroxythreonine-4-phosphate dehydrogenase
MSKPIIATMIGDPCGIGPEVCVKALAEVRLFDKCQPLLIGSQVAVQRAIDISLCDLKIVLTDSPATGQYQHGTIALIDPDDLDADDIVTAQASATCGNAVLNWMAIARGLAETGQVDGWIMASIDSTAIRLTGKLEQLDDLMPADTWLFRVSGPLRVVPIGEHLPLREVPDSVTQPAVLNLIRLLDKTLRGWGMVEPRIAVAGLNPHAMGLEEQQQIKPAIDAAQAEGITVSGPVSPDAVFRQCIEGRHDAVISMYHDQGQVAVKTAVFEGACSIFLGLPYIHLSIPHGSAYDIAGKGIAQHQSILVAMLTAAALASGEGFLSGSPNQDAA